MADKSEEDRIKKLEEEKRKESGGVASAVLHGLSEAIPGLGGIIKGLEESEAFQERLKEINKKKVTNKISSTYKNGILQVTLEKANAY